MSVADRTDDSAGLLQRALAAVKDLRARLAESERARREPIAIIGLGCRFPGGATDPESFWRLLRDGVDAIRDVPADRWDADALYDPDPLAPGKIVTRQGGFLDEIACFDAAFFRIAPREALHLDPQHRLLLEVSWEALERAGQSRELLAGSRTGVFVGITTSDYAQRIRDRGAAALDAYVPTGNALNAAAGRLSYLLGLQGPSLAVDAACASSLVAVHLACTSLRAGDCRLALAGGVNLILGPDAHIAMSRAHALAADGRCKTFAARADGYGRGEGCGVVVLKRLSDAVADGDPILAVIRGSAVMQDGHSGGLTVPNGAAQTEVIRAALAAAGLEPGDVDYVEAHGTGTPLGDPIEVRALGAALGAGRTADRPLVLGSVKTNIGHLESAAGVAGLIKVVLALRHREIPPHLHVDELNPDVAEEPTPKLIPTSPMPWPRAARGVAGVSAFGLSGTIAHVVVEEAPAPAPTPHADAEAHVLPLSAQTPEALRALARAVGDRQATATDAVADVCHSAAARRTHHDHRLAIVAATRDELTDGLAAFVAGEGRAGMTSGPRAATAPRIVFVFPGQGGQWAGMAHDLLAGEPVFAAAIADCEAALRPCVEWSLADVLRAPAHPLLERIDVVQPALFAMQVALAALWRSWGVEPQAVVGHSMGEVAAAVVAGALSLDDGARIMARRSGLLRRIAGRGAMAVVELPLEAARRELAGLEDRVAVAASNGPTTTVLSGDPAALEALLERLGRREIFARAIKVDVASHSPQVDALRADLEAALAGVRPARGVVPFWSTVAGGALDGSQLDATYWVRNLRQPVLFAPVIEQLAAQGDTVFVELSPHPTLTVGLQQIARRHGDPGDERAVLPSLRRDEPSRRVMLGSLGALYTLGHPVAWSRLHPGPRPFVALPTYPWQRERFWIDTVAEPAAPRRRRAAASPLLGERLRSPALDATVFEGEVSVAALPWLADHRIDHAVVVPGASHLVRALCGAEALHGDAPCAITDVTFPAALVLGDDEVRTAQLIVARDGAFRVMTAPAGGEDDDAAWAVHAAGRLTAVAAPPAPDEPLDAIRDRCARELSGTAFHEAMARAGYHLGPRFRWLESIRHRNGEALAVLRAPAGREEHDTYPLYPGLLDACFQLVAAAAASDAVAAMAEGGVLYVPAGVSRLVLHRRTTPADAPAVAHVVVAPGSTARDAEIAAEIRILDARGPLAEIGFRGRRVDRETFVHGARPPGDLHYRVEWRRVEPPPRADRPPAKVWLAGDGARAARLSTLLERRGVSCAPFDEARLAAAPPELVVHLGGDAHSVLAVVQAIARVAPPRPPRLALVTSGAVGIGADDVVAPFEAPVWGLARALVHEHPELRASCIDAGDAELEPLCDELLAGDREDQVALRGAERHVARLVRATLSEAPAHAAAPAATVPAGDRPFRLEIDTPGVLEELVLRPISRVAPGAEEVEIEVRAAGMNFVDVLSALGIRPDHTEGPTALGGECAGVITRVGSAVSDLRPGDAVIAALAPRCFASFVTVPRLFVVPKPAHIGFEQAATIPITYMTAHWAMHHKGRIARGERILIHAGAGGVGLAAIQLARAAGAEVFATAGSPEKRAYLEALGVAHVMDSRSLAFADELRARTGGEGVDLVLNCLTGDAVAASLGVLRAHGRFLEIGKRDIYEDRALGLYPFHQNLSYFAIDLIRMFADRPARFAELLREVVALVADGTVAPLPWTAFPISQATAAFRHMARAQHIGKVVLTFPDAGARLTPATAPATRFRPDASYLITGGLGGLGLTVARWMVEHGARHLALVGRRPPSDAADSALAALERAGARVVTVAADVASPADVARILDVIDRGLPPLRGVIHAAGILDDGTLVQQTPARFAAVAAPKIAGSWNLHQATRGRALDLFVLFSGAGSLLGAPGQGNYAAANAFLDALAAARRREGLPAQSIAWGPWSQVGLAATAARGGRLALRGVGSLTPAQGVEALGRVLDDGSPYLAVLPLELQACFKAYPALADAPFFAVLADATAPARAAAPDAPFRRALDALVPAERRGALERHLRETAARVLGLAPARIDVHKPLGNLGFDSLMTLELRNRLEASLGLRLSSTVAWNHPTIAALAEHLARRLDLVVDAPPSPEPPPPAAAAASRIDALSDDQALAMLAEKLGRYEEQRAR